MPRYIDAEKIHYRTDYNSPIYANCGGHCCQVGYDQVASYSEISEIPTADVAEVVHSRWEATGWKRGGEYEYRCAACRKNRRRTHIWRKKSQKLPLFCEKCGAKMDKETKE